jgi:hypothetical protein
MNHTPDLDTRLDEALEESFPASDPPAVHAVEPAPIGILPPPAAEPLVGVEELPGRGEAEGRH